MDNVDTMEMKLDLLYSGYRPLPIVESTPKETVMGSGTTVYEISLDLTDLLKQSNTGKGVAGIWKQSATGLVDYTGDWAGVPYEVVETLKPFVPPSELAEPVKINSKKDNLVGKIYQMIDNINKKRGRKRPLVSLLQQKKKIE